MSSQVDICNVACTILGAGLISSITDGTNQARTFNALWNTERDAELRQHIWKFSIARAKLAALSTVPASGPYNQQFQLPAGWLRVIQVGDSYPGIDLSDYRSSPTNDDYVIEGNLVLSNLSAPLSLRYVQQVTDPTQFDSAFASALSARLAKKGCFRITNSTEKEKQATADYKDAIKEAVKANALESPPTFQADDTWVATRPMGSGGAPNVRYG